MLEYKGHGATSPVKEGDWAGFKVARMRAVNSRKRLAQCSMQQATGL